MYVHLNSFVGTWKFREIATKESPYSNEAGAFVGIWRFLLEFVNFANEESPSSEGPAFDEGRAFR